MRRARFLLGLMAVSSGALAWTAAWADTPGGVSVAIKPSPSRPASHATVRLAVTVTNQGSVSRSDFTVVLTLHGLSAPKLTSAPPDSVGVSCAPTPPGAPPDCTATATPPACHSTADSLSCHYSELALGAAGSSEDSITLEETARTGGRGTETADASASFSDPSPAAGSASVKLKVGARARRSTGGKPSGAGQPASHGYGTKWKPALGKWTGNTDGFPASFTVSSQPSYRTKYGLPPYGFQDLVLDTPINCPPTPTVAEQFTSSPTHPTPFQADGSFGLAKYGLVGGLTGADTAQVSFKYNIPATPDSAGCSGTLVWHLSPAG